MKESEFITNGGGGGFIGDGGSSFIEGEDRSV